MGKNLTGKDIIKLGFPQTNAVNIALGQISRFRKNKKKESVLVELSDIFNDPEKFTGHPIWGKVSESLIAPLELKRHELRTSRVPFELFGENEIDEKAKFQFYDALKLPIAVQGALMPDAHYGYGLPIGGVLATENAVIPYGVGVDIGCRMSLSVFDLPAGFMKGKDFMLQGILRDHTRFGMHEVQDQKADHEVFERSEFREIPHLKGLLGKAYKQLGSSGGGNHFVEFGVVDVHHVQADWKIEKGQYLAVLSHSGSRGLGASIAMHYSNLAIKQCPLPKHVQHLAWLDLDKHDGQEYWLSMNLAGDYAKACHNDIHRRIAKALGHRIVLNIENHHNFAWKEMVDGKACVVHRKGATPAQDGVLGIIPGSMTAPGYIVKGKGNPLGLNSASHGAGRLMSRSQCKANINPSDLKKALIAHDVQLIGGNVEEAPGAYKNIETVMVLQNELVEVMGTFTPKIVRMAR